MKLTPEMQAVMTEAEPGAFEPFPGSWGRRGWTNVDLVEVGEETLRSALGQPCASSAIRAGCASLHCAAARS